MFWDISVLQCEIAHSKIVISIQRPISTSYMDSPSCTMRPPFTKKTSSFGRFGIGIPIRNLRRSLNCPRFIVGTPIFDRRRLFSELRSKCVHGCLHFEFLCSQHYCSMCPYVQNDAWKWPVITTWRVMDQFEPDIYTWLTKNLYTQWRMISQLQLYMIFQITIMNLR